MNPSKHITNFAGGLLALTALSGTILSSPLTSASNSAENNIQITVPVSCNLSSSTTTNHTATVDAGTYRSEIGESTITATCNDSEGFAIYAIGYTGEDYGNNTLKHTTDNTLSIASGTATSGATSNWAMKLTAVSGTYTPTIETTYQSYATVPTNYTKVASKDSSTDTVTGASFKSTYAAFISPTQHTGTYEGKVKYTLVHPITESAPLSRPVNRQFSVTYDAGNEGDAHFGDDTTVTTNTVIYDTVCDSEEREYSISKTPNIDDIGNKVSSLSVSNINDEIYDDITIPGASKLKIVLNYDVLFNEENPWDEFYGKYQKGFIWIDSGSYSAVYYGTGAQTIYIDGNSVEIGFYQDSSVTISQDHDYGYFAQIYPLDENDEETTWIEYSSCTFEEISGEYMTPTKSRSFLAGWGLTDAIDYAYQYPELMEYVLKYETSGTTVYAAWFE